MTLATGIRSADELLALPGPRFLCVPPIWLRFFVCGLAAAAAGLGGLLVRRGIIEPSAWGIYYITPGVLAIAIGLWMLVRLRPLETRNWVNLAATPEGIYFVGRRRAVLFVPWPDVSAIEVSSPIFKGGRHAVVEMRLAGDEWNGFGPLTEIRGEGPVRRITLPALAMGGKEIADELRRFRAMAAH